MGYLDRPKTYQPSADALDFQRRVKEQRLKELQREEQEHTTDLQKYYEDVAAYQTFTNIPDYRQEMSQKRNEIYSKKAQDAIAMRDTMTELLGMVIQH